MKRLYLLRHAKSSWKDKDLGDIDRPLNNRGRESATLMAEYLRHGSPPDLILCSAARRTRETLALIEPAWPGVVATRVEERLYMASLKSLFARLRALSDATGSVLLIGHNPELQALARSLAGRGDPMLLARVQEKYPTGALAIFSIDASAWADLRPGAGTLEAFIRPADLASAD